MKDFSFPKNYFQLIAMGASTGGTEALLAVLEKLPGKWDTRILATDISHNVLSKAANPRYPEESL